MDRSPTAPAGTETLWHALSAEETARRLDTDPAKGLDAAEAANRLARFGANRLPEGRKRGPLARFLTQLNNILVYVLLGAGFTKLMLGLWLDAGIIFAVVLLNALLGFIQEGRAEKALDAIRNMLSAEARTTRGGETRMIPADDLVPGDVVLLESGDKVPADLRLLDVKNLRTEEAALTGESVPAEKIADPVAEKSTVGDRENMTFSGTMVVSAATAEREYQVSGNGYASEGEVKEGDKPAERGLLLELFARNSMLCNDAEIFQQEGTWKVEGDPTEAALYPFANKLGVQREAERAAYPRIDAIPFESEHKFMATLHRGPGGKELLFVKGAPEVVMEACDRHELADGSSAPIDRERFAKIADKLAGQGERVLALAWLENPGLGQGRLSPADLPGNLVLIGLLDPPRKEAVEAIKECHGGGIRVTMITGDHRITAAAIAKMLGLGDGRKADIGVAMGIKGTEVTKEAAEMILADDNFASIAAAVKEGRTVYNNIEKAILFLFPTNFAQGLVIAVAIFLGFTLPITAPQVLWVNMVTSVALGLVICFEPHEADVMSRPPRAVERPILNGFGIWRVIFVGTAPVLFTLWAFFWMKGQGASDALARTVAVNAITIGQCFYLLNSRYLIDNSLSIKAHLGNRYLPMGIGAVIVLQLLFTYFTPLQRLFDTEAVPLYVWPWLIAGGFVFFLVVEAEKFVIRAFPNLKEAVTAVEAGRPGTRAYEA